MDAGDYFRSNADRRRWALVFGLDQSPRQYRSSTVMLSAWMQRHFRPISSLTRNPVHTLTESIVA